MNASFLHVAVAVLVAYSLALIFSALFFRFVHGCDAEIRRMTHIKITRKKPHETRKSPRNRRTH